MTLLGLTRKVKSAFGYFKKTNDTTTRFRDFCFHVLDLSQIQYEILINVLCLLTSMPADHIDEGPAYFFFKKIEKYEMISLSSLYSLRLVKGRTERYVAALSGPIRNDVLLGAKVVTVRRQNDLVYVDTDDGETRIFTKVLFACNADQALKLIECPTADEIRLLGAWRYNNGDVVLHSDHRVIPTGDLKGLFNFTYLSDENGSVNSSVSGYVSPNLIATQYPNFPIRADSIVYKAKLRTPIFDRHTIPTIAELPSLNGVLNSYFCGSHFGFGLHEDAIESAAKACKLLGVDFDDVFVDESAKGFLRYG